MEKTEARAAKTAIKTRPSRSHGRVHPGPEGKAGKKRVRCAAPRGGRRRAAPRGARSAAPA